MRIEGLPGLAVLVSFGALGVLATLRIAMLARRRINVLPIDRERRPTQVLIDLCFALSFVTLAYVAVAWALGYARALPEAWVRGGSPAAVQGVGVAVLVAALVLYGAALRAMGESWRFTIDREKPGKLVTGGVFAYSRNPIYVSLALFAVGLALVVGVVATALTAIIVVGYFPFLIRREERFLRSRYGAAYEDYCKRVGRYWTF